MLHKNICCDPSLELSLRETVLMSGTTYAQYLEIRKIFPELSSKTPPYLEVSVILFTAIYHTFDKLTISCEVPKYMIGSKEENPVVVVLLDNAVL